MHSVTHENLAVKNICSRWMLHILTEDQKEDRENCYMEMLKIFKLETLKSIYKIVICDET